MKLSTISQTVKNFFIKIKNLSPTAKKTAAIAAICALFFILGLIIPSRHNNPPQPITPTNTAQIIAAQKDSIEAARNTRLTLLEKLTKSEAAAETLRKTLSHQKMDFTTELARLRTLPPDLLYEEFATATGGIDTTAVKAYRIPTENIMQADIIFAERDFLLADSTTKYGIINALGVEKNLLKGVIIASDKEIRAVVATGNAYKAEADTQTAIAKEQTKLAKKEHARADWMRVGWVASEIATIALFLAL